MMSPSRRDHVQQDFDDHPSIAASLQDYEPSERGSPAFEIPSQHSGFRSAEQSEAESEPASAWSPPAWHRPSSGWFQHSRFASTCSPTGSREGSPSYDEGDVTMPANIPLPRSPSKQPSPSPSPAPAVKSEPEDEKQVEAAPTPSKSPDNYFRFAMRAEVQHRTDSFENAVNSVRHAVERATRSKTAIIAFVSLIVALISVFRHISQPLDEGPGPDLVKVAGLAKSFEPLIHYSEHGVQQIGDLQETGVAVWDLGETIRFSNMTSAPIITKELDNLSESLKTLAIELTRFFANVDGDIDSILIVMEWTKRELSQVTGDRPGSMQIALENIHRITSRIAGPKVADFFGRTHSQLTKATLQRTFNEFLNVLEDSINSELQYSTILFGLFEAIDRQFLNLQRTVIRETDTQVAEKERKDTELANLWRRMMGTNESRINKYEKNKMLLESIKERTKHNKLILADHNGKLLQLKSNLEILRRRLVSPLVRSNASSTLSVEEQLRGLDGTYNHLREAREKQKSKLIERLYGSNHRQGVLGEMHGIDSH